MSDSARPSRWRLHLALIAGLALCAIGFRVELARGLAGHLPAWAYVVEWPFFGLCGVILWLRLIRDDRPKHSPPAPPPDVAAASDDTELAAWQAYVIRFDAAERARQLAEDGDGGSSTR